MMNANNAASSSNSSSNSNSWFTVAESSAYDYQEYDSEYDENDSDCDEEIEGDPIAEEQLAANIRNETDAKAARREVLDVNKEHTPKSTKSNYGSRQKKFKVSMTMHNRWCTEIRKFDTGYYVDEGKLLLWLKHISERGNSRTGKPLSLESIKMHTKALINLWNHQRITEPERTNQNHPRGYSIKIFEQNLDKIYHQIKEKNFVDTGINSIQDGYTYQEYIELSMYYFKKRGAGQATFRDRMALICNHSMLLRGESLRSISLQHCSMLEFTDEGATKDCPALVFQFTGGKMNQSKKTQYSGAIRHKDVRLCAWGSIAFYFFYRFEVDQESFPDLSSNANWYDIKVLKSAKKDAKAEITYASQNASIHRAFKKVGINSSHTTHAGRGSGARIAELNGASLDQIRRMGRWDSGSLESRYLTHFNREAIRICNGFPGRKGGFWLRRDALEPPLELQQQIFPAIETWMHRLNDENDAAYQNSKSAAAFIKLMLKLRKIILQDAVLWRQLDSENRIFKEPVFSSAAFKQFEADLLVHMEATPTPSTMVLQETLPVIEQRFSEVLSEVKVNNQATVAAVQHIVQQLLTTANSSTNEQVMAKLVQIENNLLSRGIHAHDSIDTGAETSAAFPSLRAPEAPSNGVTHLSAMEVDADSRAETSNTEASSVMLSKDTSTIRELWIEWMVEGSRSTKFMTVAVLNDKFKTKWRSHQKDRTFYSRRLVIIRAVQALINDGKSLDDAINHCQTELQSSGCRSLNSYSLFLTFSNIVMVFSTIAMAFGTINVVSVREYSESKKNLTQCISSPIEFERWNVTDVVRCCKATYSQVALNEHGIQVHDWTFSDGDPPSKYIIEEWLKLIEFRFKSQKVAKDDDEAAFSKHQPCIAAHCVAGLGR
ncbi:hypothetical protein [Parasitella parasitica]|uniref:Tyrosine specific protein phosphatases domain-containing protein n=1 Tax=Parasitella parasitica TaxID=35722 RepID=A0A0B7NRF5_9FUNG|nr:hypothetical protein [Parasitella parasitica]